MIRKIGVISDTHVPHFKKLPEVIWEHFDGIELIIHAGDLSVLAVLNELEAIAPVVAVQGNIEEDEVRMKLPVKREIVVGQCRIGIVHILGDARDGLLLFNPGSATDRRRQPTCSIGLLYVDDEAQSVRGEIIWL